MSQSTNDETQDQGLLALFKGESGSGKSVAALSFPNVYVFDFDKKMPAIARKHFPWKDIHYDTFNDIFELSDKLCEFHDDCPYETLVADSFTALGNLIIKSVGITKGESVEQAMKKLNKDKSVAAMGMDYYSSEDRFITYFIQQLKSLWARPGNPRHIIVTAHVVEVEQSNILTGVVTKTRSILSKGRKPGPWLPTEFDNVYIFGLKQPDLDSISRQVKRVCLTESYGEDFAKCAYQFPAEIDFTNKSLYEELCKSYDLNKKVNIEIQNVIEGSFEVLK